MVCLAKKSKIFEGKEFYIVNGPPECGKVQMEKKVLEVTIISTYGNGRKAS